ncbi:MAG: hypothetical protein ACRCVT_10055 [Leadbetterella sp.]
MFEFVEVWESVDGKVFIRFKYHYFDGFMGDNEVVDLSIEELEKEIDILKECLQIAYKKDSE